MDIENIFNLEPYKLEKNEKRTLLTKYLNILTQHHVKNCDYYNNMLLAFALNNSQFSRIEEFPFLPVRLFKDYELKSVPNNEIIKTLTSSGTTSQKVSKIFIDKTTSGYQIKALANIIKTFLGEKRLPMLIVDTPNVIKDRTLFSARGAGILGLANFGRDHTYLLDDNMKLDVIQMELFMEKYKDEPIFIFGFTYIIWKYLYSYLKKHNIKIDLSNAVLIHSGGWKKIAEQSVSKKDFNKCLFTLTKLERIYNFYGMVEQVGSIFMDCEYGHFHTPVFSDIIMRDPLTWGVLPFKQEGIIEVLSILPHSYPGHILLTEDLGIVLGEDDCPCGRKGKYFNVSGRIPKAELRGCSDTYAYDVINI